MQFIPLQAIPNQTVQVQLAGQHYSLKVYQRASGLFIDVYQASTLIVGGVLCQDRNRIVRDAYLGFTGNLSFIDTQGLADPDYTGLNGRYGLAYVAAVKK